MRYQFITALWLVLMFGAGGHAAEPAPLTAAQERGLQPKDTFRECVDCPEMVVVPAGSFTMGSQEREASSEEVPPHVVTIRRPFAVGKLHVTVDQFAAFVRETGYDSTCREGAQSYSWRNPSFRQEGSHPVVCVGWDDAKAYADWLAKRTGKPYRLLTEAEWEYAARGRTSPGVYPRFWFGDDEKELCRYSNFHDREAGNLEAPCTDGYVNTSPAGHFRPNAFGLHDMAGNALQWTADCYHSSYRGAPTDGSAWTSGCRKDGHVARGGSFGNFSGALRSATRYSDSVADAYTGLRVARTLTP